jgi:cell division septation protein DedD
MSVRALVIVFAISSLSLIGCSREKSAWRSAQAADSPESYEQFISSHPDSTLVATARERLAQLAEEKDWRSAAEADSLEAYQQFLVQHPSGKWAREAQIRSDAFASTAVGGTATVSASLSPSAETAASESAAGAGAGAMAPDVAAPGASGGFGVQLGAFSSSERANDEWKKLQAQSSGTLDGLAPRVVVGSAAGRTIYRLQAEVRDEAHARAVCGGLKSMDKACVVVLPAP